MKDKSLISDDIPQTISEGFQRFIDLMIEEIVLTGKPFDSQKKYLKKYSENEGVDYGILEASIESFLMELGSLTPSSGMEQVESILEKGQVCHISEETIKKLVDYSISPNKSRKKGPIPDRMDKFSLKRSPWISLILGCVGILVALILFFVLRHNTHVVSSKPIERESDGLVQYDTIIQHDTIIILQRVTDVDIKEVPMANAEQIVEERINVTTGKVESSISDSSSKSVLPLQPDAKTGREMGHEWIDLGLPSGLKWATCNVGASIPSDYGNYYAWGEVSTKSRYAWSNLKYRTSGDSHGNAMFSKYNTRSDRGTIDSKRTLELSDDAARQNWQGGWRMPIKDECEELIKNCTWTRKTLNGVNGVEGTGPNGGTIFFPMAGGRNASSNNESLGSGMSIWTSSLSTGDTAAAWVFSFYTSDSAPGMGENARRYGNSVRAVLK